MQGWLAAGAGSIQIRIGRDALDAPVASSLSSYYIQTYYDSHYNP
eukprot:COSAG01_NODE_73113_length_251_cov_0.671053_1_plen_44_part_01